MAQAFVGGFGKQRHPSIQEVFFIFRVDGKWAVGDIRHAYDVGKGGTEILVVRAQGIRGGGAVRVERPKRYLPPAIFRVFWRLGENQASREGVVRRVVIRLTLGLASQRNLRRSNYIPSALIRIGSVLHGLWIVICEMCWAKHDS